MSKNTAIIQNFFEFAGSLIITNATVTIPLIAVIGIVIRNSIRMNANALPTKPNFLASIGFGLPNHVLNFPTISMFQEAPIILPYAVLWDP